jgi:hypothetical protein
MSFLSQEGGREKKRSNMRCRLTVDRLPSISGPVRAIAYATPPVNTVIGKYSTDRPGINYPTAPLQISYALLLQSCTVLYCTVLSMHVMPSHLARYLLLSSATVRGNYIRTYGWYTQRQGSWYEAGSCTADVPIAGRLDGCDSTVLTW